MDHLTEQRFGIPVGWLMEAAGWQVARQCRGRAVVVCGKGNNGGDGLAAARHLHRWGRLAGVACIDRTALKGPAAQEAGALEALGVPIADAPRLEGAELVVDALLGTGLRRAPQARMAEWIRTVNQSGLRVVAVDVPSGLDGDSGTVHEPCIRAHLTVTLGLPKPGLLTGDGPRVSGDVFVADIGIPFEAYAEIGVHVPAQLFARRETLRL